MIIPIYIAEFSAFDPLTGHRALRREIVRFDRMPSLRRRRPGAFYEAVRTGGETPRAWVRTPALARLVDPAPMPGGTPEEHARIVASNGRDGMVDDAPDRVLRLSGKGAWEGPASAVWRLALAGTLGFSFVDAPARAEVVNLVEVEVAPMPVAIPSPELVEVPIFAASSRVVLTESGRVAIARLKVELHRFGSGAIDQGSSRQEWDASGDPSWVVLAPAGVHVGRLAIRIRPDDPPPWRSPESILRSAIGGLSGLSLAPGSRDFREWAAEVETRAGERPVERVAPAREVLVGQLAFW